LAPKLAKAAGLFGVLLAVVLGGPVVDAALLAPAGAAVQVTPDVRLAPLSGWRLVGVQEGARPALLTRGSGNLAVLSLATGAGPQEVAHAYLRDYLAPVSASLVVSAAERVRLASGLEAERLAYRGQFDGGDRGGALAGEVTALVSPRGAGVVFDAWALPDVYPYERGDVRAMIQRAGVR